MDRKGPWGITGRSDIIPEEDKILRPRRRGVTLPGFTSGFAVFGLAVVLTAVLALTQPLPGRLGAAEAAGPSLQERRHQRDQDKRLSNEAEFTSKICETGISASIHWPSFETRGRNMNVVGRCDVALSALERLCRENKSKVQSSVRHVQCGAGDKRAVVISGSTIRYAVGPRAARDDHDFVYKILKRKL